MTDDAEQLPLEAEAPAPAAAPEKSVWELLREKFPPGSYALFPEVRNATGVRGDRYADAVMMSLWPSRGLEITGFEIKASRSDWLRELKDPRKAEGVACYCDRWFVLATSKDIVKVDELPKTWGLMARGARGLGVVKAAPLLTPIPADRLFIASMLRAGQKQIETAVEAAKAPYERERHLLALKVEADHREDSTRAIEQAVDAERRRGDELREALEEFRKQSGIDLLRIIHHQRWTLGKVAAAVKFLSEGHNFDSIGGIARQLSDLAKLAREAAAEMQQAAPALPEAML